MWEPAAAGVGALRRGFERRPEGFGEPLGESEACAGEDPRTESSAAASERIGALNSPSASPLPLRPGNVLLLLTFPFPPS